MSLQSESDAQNTLLASVAGHVDLFEETVAVCLSVFVDTQAVNVIQMAAHFTLRMELQIADLALIDALIEPLIKRQHSVFLLIMMIIPSDVVIKVIILLQIHRLVFFSQMLIHRLRFV